MADQEIPVVRTDDAASVAPGLLMHFSEMRGFTLPENLPDIRGWKVTLPDGRRVGKVDGDVLGTGEDTWVLVPIGAARLDDDDEVVIVDRLPAGGLTSAPRQGSGSTSGCCS